VSRSTFFRYFGDKQEVAFYDEQRLRDDIVDRERERDCPAPAHLGEALAQLRVVVVNVYAESARGQRQAVHEKLIAENPELHDRYVRKLLAWWERRSAAGDHRELRRADSPSRSGQVFYAYSGHL